MLQRQVQKDLGGLEGQHWREIYRVAHLEQDPTHLILDKQVTCPCLSLLT